MKEKIAVVGAGISGIVAAYLLDQKYEVTLFEKNNYIGGHTNTVTIPSGADRGHRVDTGFIVFNDRTYPNFIKFITQLGVEAQESEMSFSYYDAHNGFQYAGTDVNGLFAQRSNLIKPSFYKMLWDIGRFGKQGLKDLDRGSNLSSSLEDYLGENKYSPVFIDHYLKPMGAAIWSTPAGEILKFPARNFLVFFKNHGLLELTHRPVWKTIKGGSKSYVEAFLKVFSGKVRKGTSVVSVERLADKVVLKTKEEKAEAFDYVVLACHADQSLSMLEKPTPEEASYLGTWQYSKNKTVLHRDIQVLPSLKRAWASWNYVKEKEATSKSPVSLTYHMNRLQRLETKEQYMVTLNRMGPIDQKKIIKEILYEHPIYNKKSVESQSYLKQLNGKGRTFFCGAYFKYGFHEDGVTSALNAVKELGVKL